MLEGVMMRGVSHWAVAVREPSDRNGASAEAAPPENGASSNGAVELDADGQPLGQIQVHREGLVSKIKRRRVEVDYRKVLPIGVTFFAVLMTFALSAMFLDVRQAIGQ